MLFWLFCATVLMFLDTRKTAVSSIRRGLMTAAVPLQKAADLPVLLLDRVAVFFQSHQALEQAYHALQARHMALQAKVQTLRALKAENSALKALLKAVPENHDRIVLARLLALSAYPLASEAVLDKGQRDHVYIGQPVLDQFGVLGQVIAVTETTARVLLIHDARSAIPVQDTRSGVRGVVSGGEKQLRLQYVSETADVKPGDTLVTSGMGLRFPSGYPVGHVLRVAPQTKDLFQDIEVTPFAQVNRSRDVMLIWFHHTVPDSELEQQRRAMQQDKHAMRGVS